jgi:hypothetical protein
MRFVLIGLVGMLPMALAACSMHVDASAWHGGTAVQGSGKRATETRGVSVFHGVSFGGAGTVDVRVGPEQKLVIEIDDNLLPEISTEVRNGVLEIGNRHNIRSDKGIRVTVQVPRLDSMDMSGSGAARVEGLKGSKFHAEISGSGKIDATGAVDSLNLDIAGSGSANMSSLQAREVAVDISGSGSARVYARESLKADISGSGSVTYSGNPAHIKKSISGSGSVNPTR